MIELVTGTPGSGKTTYAVGVRIAAELGRSITLSDETCISLGMDPGTKVPRRIVAAGINGLVCDHERIPHILTRDATSPAEVAKWNAMRTEHDSITGKQVESDEPVHQRLPATPPVDGVPCIMQNWWLWCRPGDLIVIDEAQFVMPRGSLGRKPPYWLQALEIHRHYGVDFLIITQHPQLIDTTVRALVGLHRHVRSVMGSPVCMVYVWDHASNPERYNLANKTTFVRRSRHYRLFRSAAAHVKPPTSGRWALVAVPLLGLTAAAGLSAKMAGWIEPESAGKPQAVHVAARSNDGASLTPLAPGATVRAAAARPSGWSDVPALHGCYSVGDDCKCIDTEGQPVRIALAMCQRSASSFDGLVKWARSTSKRYEEPRQAVAPAGAASSVFGRL